ncbi:MAG: amino acid adenylation domain-containing protein [Polyangiales bacterium]
MSGSVSQLLAELRALNVALTAHEGKLKITGSAAALTPALKERITAHKPALLALLGDVGQARERGTRTLSRREVAGPRPLSYVQERIWFLELIDPGTALHNVGIALRWRGPLDVARLSRALSTLVARHDVLRTRIVTVDDGTPRQVADAPEPVALAVEPLESDSPRARELALSECIEALARTPFDLAQAPLVRFHLLGLGEGDHALVVVAHHIVWDGRSSDVFRDELTALYDALGTGSEPALPTLSVRYADFAEHLRDASAEGGFANELAYWKQAFTPLPEPLDVPADAPRATMRSGRGATVSTRFSPELTAALRALGKRQQATLQMVLLAALDVVLARLAGQPDVVVGSAYDQREEAALDGLIGCFVNTLALRTQVALDEPFSALLTRVRATSLDALANRGVPFERVVEALAPPRDTSRTPLYQVMFSYQERPRVQRAPVGVTLDELTLPTGGAATDLFLWVGNRENAVHAVLDYASDLFEEATATRLLDAFTTVLEAVARDASVPVGRLPLVSIDERAALARTLRPRPVPALEGCVHALIEAQAARTPDAPALVFEDQTLTYAQLDAHANQLAQFLAARGVARGQLVGVALERSLALPLALLAVIKTGAAYVPLDPTYPVERLHGMVEDAELALIVSDRASSPLFDTLSVARVVLEDEQDAIARGATTSLDARSEPGDPVYVIYTSGSTGKPKGVVVEHRNVANFLGGMRERLTLGAGGAWVSATSVSFDISVLEIFGALAHGLKLVFIGKTRAGIADDARHGIAQQITRHQATHFQCTPSQAVVLMADAASRAALGTLRELLVGGEALARDVADQLLGCLPNGRLLNMYGPTETTIWSSTSEVTHDAPIALGKPIVNTTFAIRDAEGELLPRGAIGELCIGGLGVARGYLRRDALTRERFVPDPDAQGERVYRTGDLVRLRNDGTLVYVGRNDFQVKIRGHRIELGEIEAALRSHAGVREAAVLARTDLGSEPRLVAYLVGDARDESTLRAHLTRAGLPAFMLPEAFVTLPRFPITGSGKLDRKALPAPSLRDAVDVGASYVAPDGETEQKLAEVFGTVLGRAQVGRDDGFFALGGHSLLAVRLVSAVRAALAVDLPIVEVFRQPRLSDLARAIDAARGTTVAGGGFPPPSTRSEAPLSFAQERLWFLDQLAGESALHNLALTLRIEGTLDVAILEAALARVIGRQEALRTRTVASRGVPTLSVQPSAQVAVTQHDLREKDEQALAHALGAFATEPFDLDAGPWLRVALFRVGPAEQVLGAVAHHATWDGTSLGIFQRELGEAYEAIRRGEVSLPEPTAARYVDYTVWERGRVDAGEYDAQIAFWKQKLASPPTLELPIDKPRALVRSSRGATERLPIDKGALTALEAVARSEHATPYMALVALIDVLALRFSGQQDIVIATPVNGRVRDELSGLIGMFVNTVLLRVDVAPELTFRALLRRVRETALEAFSHAEVPFDRVVHAVDPPRDTSRTALYQLMFSYLERTDEAGRFGGLPASHVHVDGHEAATDLFFYIPDHGSEVTAHLEYATDLFDRETAQRLLRTFARLIAFAAAHPDAALADFPVVDEAELAHVITPRLEAPVPAPLRIDQMLTAQAARTPDATALIYRDGSHSYAQLEAEANRLAHVLVQRGARRDGFVGVCMRRTDALIVALLAVVKSGAAYLPLDPAYPDERLRYMVDDARASLVITEADTAAMVQGTSATVLRWEELRPQAAAQPSTPPAFEASERDLMYVIYTSGSTGKPKGVMVEHRQVASLFNAMRAHTLAAPGTWLSSTSVSFDISVCEVFGTLTRGCTIVLVGGGTPAGEGMPALPEQPPYDIASLIAKHQVTHYQCTPSQALLLLGDPAAREALSHVREMVVGGEALSLDLAIQLQKHLVNGKLINMYGPTETTVWATVWPVPPEPTHIGLGAPLDTLQLRILDPRGKPVPVGVSGELFIAGRGVTRGYLGRDALTHERFVADPFGAPGERMYKTGDLVRVRNDGTLTYLGRNDFQVKIRGFRIELGEIEDALRSLAHVREAVVVARDEGQGDLRLIAYLVPGDTTPSDVAALRTALRTRLPDYMVPAAFVTLDALPLTGSGKVDRARLPAPAKETRDARPAELGSELEQKLAACWQGVLKTGHVGPDDNFFDLGGHSLLMGRLADEISTALGRRVSIPELFQFPSVRALARHLDAPAASSRSVGQQRATERRAATRNVQGRRG